jgi:trehalose-phosphatase
VSREGWIAIEPEAIDAVLFDLDGVVTSTHHLHAVAWKEIFDDLLAQRRQQGDDQAPFDIATDYNEHVDGKPRMRGVRDFLAARGIELPEGEPGQAPGLGTMHAIAARKDERFRELLHAEGPEVYEDAVDLLDRLDRAGIACGLFSASRNAREVLRMAELEHRFATIVDGEVAREEELPGKPEPDTLVETARRLDAAPSRAVVLEDAEAGVEAGQQGGFALVVGVDRVGHRDALAERGADRVVSTLGDLLVPTRDPDELGSALADEALFARLEAADPVVFLDFDGTVSPIVDDPDAAQLAEGLQAAIQRVADEATVAVISGRDVDDVAERVGLFGLYYAGSHGFEIQRPDGTRFRLTVPDEQVASLADAETELREGVADVAGALVERKQASVAVHDRQVADDERQRVREAVDRVRRAHPDLRVSPGKRVHEVRPDVDWHKGKAVETLLAELDVDPAERPVVYVGDDVTDEDAFRTVPQAIRVLVRGEHERTHADRVLADPTEVGTFLHRVADRLGEGRP